MDKYYIGHIFENGNVIIDGPQKVSNHNVQWKARCICGNERWTYASSLRKSIHPCKNCYDNSMKSFDKKPAIQKAFISLKSNAKSRNISVDIDWKDFYEVAIEDCFYCGAEPIEKTAPKKWQPSVKLNGLDRVDNTKGYSVDNIVSCCYDCNRMKSDLSEENFLRHIRKIYNWSINA
jgi:hypothetical protein